MARIVRDKNALDFIAVRLTKMYECFKDARMKAIFTGEKTLKPCLLLCYVIVKLKYDIVQTSTTHETNRAALFNQCHFVIGSPCVAIDPQVSAIQCCE